MNPPSSEWVSVALGNGGELLLPPDLAPRHAPRRKQRSDEVRCHCAICRSQDALPLRLHGIPGAWQLAMPLPEFDHYWFWRQKLGDRRGQRCRVVARGRMNSILVEFGDGYRVVTSRHAVRRLKPPSPEPADRDTSRAPAPGVSAVPAAPAPAAADDAAESVLPLQI